jgi:hypothetical protein
MEMLKGNIVESTKIAADVKGDRIVFNPKSA